MKIQINATGKFENVPLKVAQRKINKGIAHIAKEEVKKIVVEKVIEEVKPKVKRKRKVKDIDEIKIIEEPKPEEEREW